MKEVGVVVYCPPVCAVLPNYEVVDFQPWSVTDSNLGYFHYFHISIFLSPLSAPSVIRLSSKRYYPSYPVHRHRLSILCTVSSTQLGITVIHLSTPLLRSLSTGSSAHLIISCIRCCCNISCHQFVVARSLLIYLLPRLTNSCRLRSRVLHDIYFNFDLNWASATVCCHHRDRLCHPPANPVSF